MRATWLSLRIPMDYHQKLSEEALVVQHAHPRVGRNIFQLSYQDVVCRNRVFPLFIFISRQGNGVLRKTRLIHLFILRLFLFMNYLFVTSCPIPFKLQGVNIGSTRTFRLYFILFKQYGGRMREPRRGRSRGQMGRRLLSLLCLLQNRFLFFLSLFFEFFSLYHFQYKGFVLRFFFFRYLASWGYSCYLCFMTTAT